MLYTFVTTSLRKKNGEGRGFSKKDDAEGRLGYTVSQREREVCVRVYTRRKTGGNAKRARDEKVSTDTDIEADCTLRQCIYSSKSNNLAYPHTHTRIMRLCIDDDF